MILDEKAKVIKTISDGKNKFEVLEFENLDGATDPTMAMALYFAKKAGLKSRVVRVSLDNSSIKTEAGALYFYKGNISSDTKVGGAGGFFKKSISGALTGESILKPSYTGSGEVYLEPSFKHYCAMTLDNESIIVDKGVFYCCSDSIELSAVSQKNISSAVMGGEGIFQLQLKGSGVVILELPVPESEIVKCTLNGDEELKVDGNFAIARTSGVNFSVTKSQKSLFRSAMGGEGFLNTYTGSGSVWIAPTAPVYNDLSFGFLGSNDSMDNEE